MAMADDKKNTAELRIYCDEALKARLVEIAREEVRSISGQVVFFLIKAIKDYDSTGE